MRQCSSLSNVYFALRNADFSNCLILVLDNCFYGTVKIYFQKLILLSNGKLCWDNSSGTTFETVCVSRLRAAGT